MGRRVRMQEARRDCPCKKLKCPRHGDCAACRQHHSTQSKLPPYCERAEKKDKEPRGKESGSEKNFCEAFAKSVKLLRGR